MTATPQLASTWSQEEWGQVAERLLALPDLQLGAIFVAVGGFSPKDVFTILADDVRVHGVESGHLPILIDEAPSRASILNLLEYFETHD